MKSLAIVVVNYRTPDLAIACLEALAEQVAARAGWKVVVVDNHSEDGSPERICEAIARRGWESWVRVQALAENRGFAGGNNAALRPLLDSPEPPAYFVLLNPDTMVRPGALEALLDFMERHPRVGIAGSRLEDPDGTPQRSAFRFPTVVSELENGLRFGPLSRLLRRWVVAPPVQERPHPTDWVAGASMIVRRAVFETAGLMDEGYFLYFEEVDFCLRARRKGWPCWYVPASRVVHLVGRSSGVTETKRPARRLPAYWFASRRRFFRKNYGRLYARLADAAWLSGFTCWRLRRWVQRKPDTDPPHLLGDFIHFQWTGHESRPVSPRAAADRGGWAPSPAGARRSILDHGGRAMETPTALPLPRGDRNQNPPGIGFWALLREDLRTHDGNLFEQGFWAVAVHRFGNWRMGVRWKILRAPLTVLYRLLFKWVEWTCGITLPYTTRLGRRVRLWHHSGMILHARSIGDDTHIRHNTTFGVVRRDHNWEIPVIGERVDIGCGACVLGNVRVANDSVIGANAVVLQDIPPYSVAVGAPARVVKSLRAASSDAAKAVAVP